MEKLTLSNGLRVLLDWQDQARSASFGVWVKSGPAYESRENNGISHFMEHMVFKGTATRTSLRISEEMDSIGGQMNAYTTTDFTCFYARALEEHVGQAFDIVSDMVVNPRFDPKDLELEKSVVAEEISMNEDQPEDRVAENLYRHIWPDSPMGMPILGTRDTLKGLGQQEMFCYHALHYAPDQVVVAICGRFDREAFLRQIQDRFGALKQSNVQTAAPPMEYVPSCSFENSKQEQTHLSLGLPGISLWDSRKYALSILNMILGGSSSSRLFQKIREELGLAYSISSGISSYERGGLLEIQTAVSPGEDRRACQEILGVLSTLRREGVTEKEFLRAREQLKSNLVMGMENTTARAGHMGRGEILRGRVESEDDILNQISKVTWELVNQTARELLDPNRLSVSVVGPSDQEAYYQSIVGSSQPGVF